MKIAIASDKRAIGRKLEVKRFLEEQGHTVIEVVPDENTAVVHTISAPKVCKLVQSGEVDRGILICGTGIGISITANKMEGIRAALCTDCFCAEATRLHNDANVLVMPGRYISTEEADMIMTEFFSTEFEGGRHQKRIDKIPVK